MVKWSKNPWVAIIVTAILFSVIHYSYYGFLVRFALGIILGLVFYYTGNLWLAILMHFLYNGIQVTALYLINSSGVKAPKDIEENFPIWAGVIAFVLIIYAFIRLKEISSTIKPKSEEINLDNQNGFENWVNN